MIINDFSANNFRNIENLTLNAHEKLNIIIGENAQGKTNILEGMWMFSGFKSFRGSKEKEMIRFSEKCASLSVDFTDGGRRREAALILSDKKKLTLNGVKEENFKRMSENYKMIVFSPSHLSLIKDGPEERRNFLDCALSTIRGGYYSLLTVYSKTLFQRNALLKKVRNNSSYSLLLDTWDERLAFLGAKIIVQRKKYISHLLPYIKEVFSGISDGRESVEMRYSSFQDELDEKMINQKLLREIYDSRKEDIELMRTEKGPHRDDLIIDINDKSLRAYGSQGQQRSCALALKIAEASVLKNITGTSPVILLDDVMSELDAKRQEYVLRNIEDNQIFITACEESELLKKADGKTFRIKNGAIV